jgi:TonB family protein
VPGTADAARYVRDLQDERFPGRAPGSSDYYRHLGQRVFDQWRPPSVSPPSVGDTLLTNFVAPTAVSIVAAGLMQGPLANGRGGAAIDALNQAHPNSPTLQPANNATAIAEATARVMRADVEIDQDEHGVLIAARLVRSSGSVMFDQRALAAVREAAGAAERRAMPGGWRSRWSFEVITSRDPAVLLAPTLPGETPGLLPAWIETTSDGEVHTALRVHQRRRVTLITSRQLHAR